MFLKLLLLTTFATVCLCNKLDTYRLIDEKQSVEEYEGPPIPYNFEFKTDDENGTSQFRSETKDSNGKVEGRYGYKDVFGVERIVEYVADENGYRATIKTNEPGIESMSAANAQYYANPLPSTYQTHQPNAAVTAEGSSSKGSTQNQQFTNSISTQQQQDLSRLNSRNQEKSQAPSKSSESKKFVTAHFSGVQVEEKKQHVATKEQTQTAKQSHSSLPQFNNQFIQHQPIAIAPGPYFQNSPAERSFYQSRPVHLVQPQHFSPEATHPHYPQQAAQPVIVHYLAPQNQPLAYQSGAIQAQATNAFPALGFRQGYIVQNGPMSPASPPA